MAAEVRSFTATVTAGTLQAAPLTIALTMPPRLVRWVRWRVPPGPAGVLGWALGAAGVRVLPWGDQQWIVADNESDRWDLEEQIDSGAWQLQGYNTGVYDHSVYLHFGLDPIGSRTQPALVAPLAL